jgi:GNAT superfamily N-acetyltransferase
MLKPLHLLTPRLVLRRATLRDIETLQRECCDGDMPRWCVKAHGSGVDGHGVDLYVIALAGSGVDIGCAGLRPSAVAQPLCDGCAEAFEPLLWLQPEHRGLGYAQEAMKAVLWHAQSATHGRCFVAVCDVPNSAGDRWLRRLGFVPGYEADGVPCRVRQYGLPTTPVLATP